MYKKDNAGFTEELSKLKVWDRHYLLTQIGGNSVVINQLLDMFLNDSPEQMSRLELAIAECDAKEVISQAHGLKGVALNLGFNQFAAIATQMEAGGKNADLESVKGYFPYLQQAFEAVKVELLRYKNQN